MSKGVFRIKQNVHQPEDIGVEVEETRRLDAAADTMSRS